MVQKEIIQNNKLTNIQSKMDLLSQITFQVPLFFTPLPLNPLGRKNRRPNAKLHLPRLPPNRANRQRRGHAGDPRQPGPVHPAADQNGPGGLGDLIGDSVQIRVQLSNIFG